MFSGVATPATKYAAITQPGDAKGMGTMTSLGWGRFVITYKQQGWYKKAAHRKWRRLVMQRDNWVCQECLRRGRITPATEAHHIIPLEDRPDLALDVDNGEGLCRKCHELTKERKYKRAPVGVRVIKL